MISPARPRQVSSTGGINTPNSALPRRNRLSTPAIVGLGVLMLVILLYPLFPIDLPFARHPVGVSTMADVGIYMLLALGLNIVIGYAGLLDLGYAAFFAIGSYTYALLASPQHNIHLPFWLLLFVSAGVAATFGAVLGAPTLRLRGDYLAIVTLGFGEIVPTVFLNLDSLTGGTNGISGVDYPVLGIPFTNIGIPFGALDATPYYYLILIMVIAAVIIISRLRESRLGRAWMAIREDELAAAATGINTTTTKLLAFGIGAAFSGFAGSLYASKLAFIGPGQFDFNVSVFILCMIILGGMGNIWGVMLGAAILYIMQSTVLTQLPSVLHELGTQNHIDFLVKTDFSGLRYLIYGVALVVMMLVRPEGLLPSARRKAELHPDTPEQARREDGQELYDVRSGEAESSTKGGVEV